MKTLKLLLASALTGLPFLIPTWGQDRPPEAQPAPLPDGVKRLVVESQGSKTPELRSPCFSPDGRILAATGDDNRIYLWDLPSGKELPPIQGHEKWISCLAFLPDGKTLVSRGSDKTIRLWEALTGKQIHVLNGSYWQFTCSPDGRILAAIDGGGIFMLDLATMKEMPRIKGPEEGLWSLAFSPDGKVLAAGGSRGHVYLWEVAQGKEVLRFKAEEGKWVAIAWSMDGHRIATATYGGNAYRVWDVSTGKEVFQIKEAGS